MVSHKDFRLLQRILTFSIDKFSVDVRAFRTMLDELCGLIRKGKLAAPVCAELGLQDYGKALNAALQPFTSAKQVLIM